jgi:Skp family chaperone for outer membrane proteins
MVSKRIGIIATAAVVAGLGFASVQANRLLRGTPTAAAVVEVQRVIDSLKEKDVIEAQMQQTNDRVQKEKNDRERAIKQMQDELQLLTPGTENHRKKLEAAEKSVIELQAWLQFENNKLVRERGIQIEGLYQKILKAIAEVAKTNGYQLVLFAEGPAEFRAENLQQLTTLIQIRKVLYYEPSLDITDLVTQKMNNDFQNR